MILSKISIAQAPVYPSPNPITFICSKKADGKTNGEDDNIEAVFGWNGYAELAPRAEKNDMITCIKEKIKNLNIVIGCPIGCRYCYAKNNCRRFHITKDFSKPEFFEGKLQLFDSKEPKVFLLTGMSDFGYWQPEWIEKVFEKAASTPQNTYLFLTKRPERLNIQTDLDNLWFGVTVTCTAEKARMEILKCNVKAKHYHVTFEPLSDAVGEVDFSGIEWVVLGTETGNCKGKTPSQKSWIDGLYAQAAAKNIPVFMKEDLYTDGIMSEGRMIQQFPKEFKL